MAHTSAPSDGRRLIGWLIVRWLTVATLSVLAAGACSSSGPGSGPAAPGVAARIDGETITSSQVQELADQYVRAADGGEDLSAKAARRVVLDFLIRLTYLQVLAQDRSIAVEGNARLERILAATTPEDFAGTGWTPDDVRNGTVAGELSQKLAADIFPAVAVPEGEAQRRYEEQQARFQAGWSAAVHVAYVASPDAAQALAGAASAADFDARATRAGATQAGSMGTVTSATSLPPDIIAAIAALPAGQVSAPIPTAGGSLVFYVDSREDVPATAPADALAQIKRALEDEKRQQLFDTWFSERLRAAAVEVDPYFGTWNEAVGGVR